MWCTDWAANSSLSSMLRTCQLLRVLCTQSPTHLLMSSGRLRQYRFLNAVVASSSKPVLILGPSRCGLSTMILESEATSEP